MNLKYITYRLVPATLNLKDARDWGVEFNSRIVAAPPDVAQAVYIAKNKYDGTINLHSVNPILYVAEQQVFSDDSPLQMLLRVEVKLMTAIKNNAAIENFPFKYMYFDLLVLSKGRMYFVIECHCHDNHGAGNYHIHRAVPKRGRKSEVRIPWVGITERTTVSEAFSSAMGIMSIKAEYQVQ